MASIKTSNLQVLNTITSDDYLPLVDSGSGTSYKADFNTVNGWMSTYGTSSKSIRSVSSVSSSYASSSVSSSYAIVNVSSSYTVYTTSASYSEYAASYPATASYALFAASSSLALVAQLATSASYSITSSNSISSSYSFSGSYAITASHALNSLSASYAQTASVALKVANAILPVYKYGPYFAVLGSGEFETFDIDKRKIILHFPEAGEAIIEAYANIRWWKDDSYDHWVASTMWMDRDPTTTPSFIYDSNDYAWLWSGVREDESATTHHLSCYSGSYAQGDHTLYFKLTGGTLSSGLTPIQQWDSFASSSVQSGAATDSNWHGYYEPTPRAVRVFVHSTTQVGQVLAAGQSIGGGTDINNYEVIDDGGSGCPAVWQEMYTKERGWIRADELLPGMNLDGVDSEWAEIYSVSIRPAPIWRCVIDGCTFDVDSTHLWLMYDNQWKCVRDLVVGDKVLAKDGGHLIVESSQYLKDGEYVALKVEGEKYTMSTKCAIAHNSTVSGRRIIYKA